MDSQLQETIARAIYDEMDLDGPSYGFEHDHAARNLAMRQASAVIAAMKGAGLAIMMREHLLVQIGLVAAAGGKIEVRPNDLYHARDMVLNRYERPTDGAVVFTVERKAP